VDPSDDDKKCIYLQHSMAWARSYLEHFRAYGHLGKYGPHGTQIWERTIIACQDKQIEEKIRRLGLYIPAASSYDARKTHKYEW